MDAFLAERFETHRPHLRGVAYRMLGSSGAADDAVREAWIRLSRSEAAGVDGLGGWLTSVVGRVCLDVLRSRVRRLEDLPEPEAAVVDPVADSVGLALLVVLGSLPPQERLAFVLHDLFGLPYEEIAPIAGRTATATRQLAGRARRRVRGTAP